MRSLPGRLIAALGVLLVCSCGRDQPLSPTEAGSVTRQAALSVRPALSVIRRADIARWPRSRARSRCLVAGHFERFRCRLDLWRRVGREGEVRVSRRTQSSFRLFPFQSNFASHRKSSGAMA